MDRKPVYLISNFHGSEQSEVLRTMKNDSRQSRLFRALYGLDRKSYKWWHRIFFGFVDRAMANAYICYLKSGVPKIPNLEFRKKVTLGLLSLGHAPKVGRPLTTLAVNVVKEKRRKLSYSVPDSFWKSHNVIHWMQFSDKRSRCEVCCRNGRDSRPFTFCVTCKVYLYFTRDKNCFAEYHGLSNK